MKILKVTGIVKLFFFLIKSLKNQRVLNVNLLQILIFRTQHYEDKRNWYEREIQRLKNKNLNSWQRRRNMLWLQNGK